MMAVCSGHVSKGTRACLLFWFSFAHTLVCFCTLWSLKCARHALDFRCVLIHGRVMVDTGVFVGLVVGLY